MNPLKAIARWFRRRRRPGLMEVTREGLRPYDGSKLTKIEAATLDDLRQKGAADVAHLR